LLELEVVPGIFVELDFSVESFSEVLLPLTFDEHLSLVDGEVEG
jgi:hypothetical protein